MCMFYSKYYMEYQWGQGRCLSQRQSYFREQSVSVCRRVRRILKMLAISFDSRCF